MAELNPRSRQSDWLSAFQSWAAEPCPEGEWVYRGQAAEYTQILPSALRESNRAMFDNGLYNVYDAVAADIFQDSLIFKDSSLYPHVIDDEHGLMFQNLLYSMGEGPPSNNPRLSYPEVIRALVQHYGHPTLFIDISFNPMVAALFAANRWTDSGCGVREKGEGTVFRWPAVRKSHSRLSIPVHGDDPINVVDISRISPYMQRPYCQCAALATPVYDPKPMYQTFRSSSSALICEDMGELRCCELFTIPAGGGHELNRLDGVSTAALFPDTIDLGYSYIGVIALVSMLLHRLVDDKYIPLEWRCDTINPQALTTARAILDRECLRNIPGLAIPGHLSGMTAEEARLSLMSLAEQAYAQIDMMDIDIIKALEGPATEQLLEEGQAEANKMYAIYSSVLRDHGVKRVAPKPKLSFRKPPPELVRKRLDACMRTVESIIETMEFVPVYALERPTEFRGHIDSLSSSDDYEKAVLEQTVAVNCWLGCRQFSDSTTR